MQVVCDASATTLLHKPEVSVPIVAQLELETFQPCQVDVEWKLLCTACSKSLKSDGIGRIQHLEAFRFNRLALFVQHALPANMPLSGAFPAFLVTFADGSGCHMSAAAGLCMHSALKV